jgi:hypothetical protein
MEYSASNETHQPYQQNRKIILYEWKQWMMTHIIKSADNLNNGTQVKSDLSLCSRTHILINIQVR